MMRALILAFAIVALSTPSVAECPPEDLGCTEATELFEAADDHPIVDLVDDTGTDDVPSMDEVMEEESETFEDDDIVD